MWKVMIRRGRIGFDVYYRHRRQDAESLKHMLEQMYPRCNVTIEEVTKKL